MMSFMLAAALSCPETAPTPESLTQWRLEAAQSLNSGSITDGAMSDLLKRCFGSQVPACLQRVNDYAGRNDIAAPAQDQTVRDAAQKQPPSELFLSSSDPFSYLVPETIEERAAALGWPSVRYKSRHSGGFDRDTASLLMIYVPGSKVNPPVNFDRWLNFALPSDSEAEGLNPTPGAPVPSPADYEAEARGELSLPRIFTMVSLDRRNGSSAAQVYFQRFVRTRGKAAFKAEENANPKRCIGCHPNGLRAISPLGYHVRSGESRMNDSDWETVKLINDAMVQAAGTRPVTWRDAPVRAGSTERKPLLKPAANGPAIGPLKALNSRSRTQAFIAQCAQKRRTVEVKDIFGRAPGRNNVYRMSANPQIDADKILRFMSCSACHGGATRSPLNALTDWEQVDFKILVDQSMPLGTHQDPLESGTAEVQDQLNGDERLALANCLLAEYELEQKETVAWLTQGECR